MNRMKVEYFKEYSNELGRDMEFKSYGHAGKPVLVIPCQNGRFFEWEDFGMISLLSPYIDDGRIQIFTCDTLDAESVSGTGNPADRVRRQEAWNRYLTLELVPRIHQLAGNGDKLLVTGLSMGAYHAANLFFRWPDLFDAVIALSGLYDTSMIYGGYMDDLVYLNDPCVSIAGMPSDHRYIPLYNRSKICICVGQGSWEDDTIRSTRRLDGVLRSKGINAWVDYWGYDSCHDWPWWRKQLVYFLDYVLR